MTSLPTTTTTQIPATARADALAHRPGGLAAAPAAGGMTAAQIISMLRRHIWLIVIVFFIAIIIDAGVFVLCLRYAKEYTAEGRMQLLTTVMPVTGGMDRDIAQWRIENQARTEAMRLTSENHIFNLLQDSEAKVRLAKWIATHPPGKFTAEVQFVQKLSASPVRDTAMVAVSFKDPDPEVAAEVVDTLMEFTQRRQSLAGDPLSQKTIDAIQGELNKLNGKKDGLLSQLSGIKNNRDYEGLDLARSHIQERVTQLNSLHTQARVYYEQALHAYETLAKDYSNPKAQLSKERMEAVEKDQSLLSLRARKQALIEERAVLLQKSYGANHTRIIEIDTRIDETENAIQDKRTELIALEKDRVLAAARAAMESGEIQVRNIQKDLDEAVAKKKDLTSLWENFQTIAAEKAANDKRIAEYEERLAVRKMEVERNLPQVQVLIRASKPQEYTFPNWRVFLAGGIVVGLALAVGLVFLIEFADNTVRTPRDLGEQARLPLLGFVPIAADKDGPLGRMARLAVAEPGSMVAECFRQVRTNLLFAAPVDQLNSVLVTSASPGEGKSFISSNLAITVALSGRRVLLVDANFRRPALAGVFKLDGAAVGLSNVLTNQSSLAEAAQPTDVPNLSILPTGPVPPNPAELLGSATMRGLLDQALADYDLVLFDGPPALIVSDAIVLSTLVDGVVTVVRAQSTSRGMVQRLREQLRRVNARIVGAVLNAARPTRGGYFRKSFQEYQDYQANNKPSPSPAA